MIKKDFSLTISSDWMEMLRVNEQARRFFQSCNLPRETVDTFTMVACELVENGIKYGGTGNIKNAPLTLALDIDGQTITIQVSNSTSSENGYHLRELDRTLQWIRGFQDPFQAYIERLKQISKEPSNKGTSGLGIVRIAYEARAAIDFVLSEDDTLEVSAIARISK